MDKLTALIEYICNFYPVKDHLSNARVTKLVYLTDWRSVLEHGRPITTIRWEFQHFGPWVDDVVNSARRNPNIEIVHTSTFTGKPKSLFRSVGAPDLTALNKADMSIADSVIAETQGMFFNQFIEHVYSSYPVASRDRYDVLDLPLIGEECRRSGYQF